MKISNNSWLKANNKKLSELIGIIEKCGKLIVAWSGGVDSTLLAFLSNKIKGKDSLIITISGPLYPKSSIDRTKKLAEKFNFNHKIIKIKKVDIGEFAKNDRTRCYHCKNILYKRLLETGKELGIEEIFDGSNADDLTDYRPGLKAIKELGIKSPLLMAGISKKEIRKFSKGFGLETWDIPQEACLASRFPYGKRIETKELRKVENAEEFLKGVGFRQVRVRNYGELARIEVEKKKLKKY